MSSKKITIKMVCEGCGKLKNCRDGFCAKCTISKKKSGNDIIQRLDESSDIHDFRKTANQIIDVVDQIQFDIIRIDEQLLILFKEAVMLKHQTEGIKNQQSNE